MTTSSSAAAGFAGRVVLSGAKRSRRIPRWYRKVMQRDASTKASLASSTSLGMTVLPDKWLKKFCSRSALFRTRKPRGGFRINWSSENFAACANILPAVESIYRWKEKIETGKRNHSSFSRLSAGSTISVSGQSCARFIRTKFRRSFSFQIDSGSAGLSALGCRELRSKRADRSAFACQA